MTLWAGFNSILDQVQARSGQTEAQRSHNRWSDLCRAPDLWIPEGARDREATLARIHSNRAQSKENYGAL